MTLERRTMARDHLDLELEPSESVWEATGVLSKGGHGRVYYF